MKYVGSKNRIAKDIIPLMIKDRKPNQWFVDLFAGDMNLIDKIEGNRIANDSNKYLIEMFKAIISGEFIPPDYVSEELWRDVKEKDLSKYPAYFIAFVRLGCSFGADWNGGYARNVKKTAPNAEVLNSTIKSYCKQNSKELKASLYPVVFS